MTPPTDISLLPELVEVIDSHTGGEPTRVVVSGGPDLGKGTCAERREVFRTGHDAFRAALINEPRGSDILVGALLCEPADPANAAGAIFFNNTGYLNMCGHGAIGVAVTLAHLGRIAPGTHRLETPVGTIAFELHDSGPVTIENVPSYRSARDVTLEIDGHGPVTGDVAWGGNWFFLADWPQAELTPDNIPSLTRITTAIRSALERDSITGDKGALIDHIELSSASPNPGIDARNFVLCPGLAYDRSPCGTGTSAKIACLIADGDLAEGHLWRQESIVGSVFEASGRSNGKGAVIPRIAGRAFITAVSTLHFQPADPFRVGIPR